MISRRTFALLFSLLALCFTLAPARPAAAAETLFEVPAPIFGQAYRSLYMIDADTGQELLADQPDLPLPPASLTKIMTLRLAYRALEEGKVTLDEVITVSERAWAQNCPGCSVMFLEPGMKISFGELLKGIAIASGNDACIAVAERLGGSVEGFVQMMNDEAKALGLEVTYFVDPHGLSAENQVTAREIAQLARIYLAEAPEALLLHSQESYTTVLPDGKQITQFNRNPLLGEYPGADGLKTGFIDEAGYNLVATAQHGETRLIAVIMGAESEAERGELATAFLNWGFDNFETYTPETTALATVPLYKGKEKSLDLVAADTTPFVVPRGAAAEVTVMVSPPTYLEAPVEKGHKVGTVTYLYKGQELKQVDLVAGDEAPAGGFFKRLFDTLRLFVLRLLKKI